MSSFIGQHLGRYVVASKLGQGGMAEVYGARDTKLGRDVAVKVILPRFAAETQFVGRFLREARAVASLEHPHILPIYDYGEHEGLPFLVMQLVRGGTLAERLEGGPLPPELVVGWARQLASALDAAHAVGVLHRDVKPGNVLLGRDHRLFLADFGIAKLAGATTRLTTTGMVVGTPLYMSPEVAAGQGASAASDRYALAVMIYEMLAGKPPFEGENALSILHQHTTRPVPPLSQRVEHLPVGIDSALERGLAKEPEARPASCRALVDSLAFHLSSQDRLMAGGALDVGDDAAPTLELSSPPPSAQKTELAPTIPTPGPPVPVSTPVTATSGAYERPPRRWIWAAGLAGGVAVVSGVLLLRQISSPVPEPVGPPVSLEPAAPNVGEAEIPEVEAIADPVAASEDPPQSSAPQSPSAEKAVAETPPATPAVVVPEPQVPDLPPGAPSPRPPAVPAERERPFVPLTRDPGNYPQEMLRSFQAQELRDGTRRPTKRDFQKAMESAERLVRSESRSPVASAIETFGRGGLAFFDGGGDTADSALRKVVSNERFLRFWGPSVFTLLNRPNRSAAFADWEIALGYGDPLKSAGAELEHRLAEDPRDLALRFGRALVHRLDGSHQEVVREASSVYAKLDGSASELKSFAAQTVADAHVSLGQLDEAFSWYRRAYDAGGLHRGVPVFRAGMLAREEGLVEEARSFMELACEADVVVACRMTRRGQRPLRRPGGR